MPLYEYECFLCHHRFERIQKVNDEPVTECPACGGAVRRLLGVPALQFKGSGFYITDYGKGNGGGGSKNSAKGESSSASSETKSEAKSETKPAAKSDSGGGEKKPA